MCAPALALLLLVTLSLQPALAAAADPPVRKPVPESAPFPPPPAPRTKPPILCDATATPPTERDAADPGSYDRSALQQWQAVYAQCPSTANLYQLATASEVVGRRERSVILLEQALSLHQRYLDAEPGSTLRAPIEQRMAVVRGAIKARRLRSLLEDARRHERAGAWREAVAGYDRYLAVADGDPERPAVVDARARAVMEMELADREVRAARLRRAGVVLVVAGALVGVVGGLSLAVSRTTADEAAHATDAPTHNQKLSLSSTEQTIGYACIGVGAAALVSGVVALSLSRRPARPDGDRPAPPLRLLETAWVAPAPGGLVVGGTF